MCLDSRIHFCLDKKKVNLKLNIVKRSGPTSTSPGWGGGGGGVAVHLGNSAFI